MVWTFIIFYLGLVGFTVAVATGKILDGTRTWLKNFTYQWNPLRLLGHLLGCSLCIGFWVGFFGLGPWWEILEGSQPWMKEADGWLRLAVHVSSGGMVSLASYIVDVVLRGAEVVVADKEQQHEYVRTQLARGDDKAAARGKPDMAAGGGSAVEGTAGDQEAG